MMPAAADAGFTKRPRLSRLLKQIRRRDEKRLWKTLGSSCGCRASSPASRIGLEHARRYGSPENRRAFVEFATGRSKSPRDRPAVEKQMEELDHRRHAEAGDR